jgi:hypothetical protein
LAVLGGSFSSRAPKRRPWDPGFFAAVVVVFGTDVLCAGGRELGSLAELRETSSGFGDLRVALTLLTVLPAADREK